MKPAFPNLLVTVINCYINTCNIMFVGIPWICWRRLKTPYLYMFFYALKELRHLINDIKLDTVLTINKPLTKTSRAVAGGKVWRFPFCAICIPLVWMDHKYYSRNTSYVLYYISTLLLWGKTPPNDKDFYSVKQTWKFNCIQKVYIEKSLT